MQNRNVFTVSRINSYIKSVFQDDIVLNDVLIEGEISNCKYHSSGNLYFSLKDEQSAIKCIIFSSFANSLSFQLSDGMYVLLYGRVILFEKSGQYHLMCEYIQPVGVGALHTAFEQLKIKLAAEGLFAQEHKKNLPACPKRVAIITSPTGAAVRDVIKISRSRNKSVQLTVVPAIVQGKDAPLSIKRAIEEVNVWGAADIIILCRGGGSAEDLWAFNDERIAYAIFNSKIPIVSGVGHETDFTIADFVADVRASTPSAAAELVVPEQNLLNEQINYTVCKLTECLNQKIQYNKFILNSFLERGLIKNQVDNLKSYRLDLISRVRELKFGFEKNLQTMKLMLDNKINLLNNISPSNVMKQGYALAFNISTGEKVSAKKLQDDDIIKIIFHDGEVTAKIMSSKKGE